MMIRFYKSYNQKKKSGFLRFMFKKNFLCIKIFYFDNNSYDIIIVEHDGTS